jgi:hypothetical protein
MVPLSFPPTADLVCKTQGYQYLPAALPEQKIGTSIARWRTNRLEMDHAL